MNYLQILVLALIQGAAELLPVSSSAHVIVAEKLMGLDPAAPEMTFLLVMLHTGTMGAVLVYFWPRWKRVIFSRPVAGADGKTPSGWHFPLLVLVATVLTGVLGYGLKILIEKVVFHRLLGQEGEVEHLFRNLPLIAAALFAVGIFIIVAGSRSSKTEMPVVSFQSAVVIGLVQGLCLPFRGFSRSGATISTALCCGVTRPLAEDFSFALAVVLTPPVIAVELFRLLKAPDWSGKSGPAELLLPGLVGMALSCLAGLVALRLLSAVLERGRWKCFGYYCIVASAVVLAVAVCGF
jgi:undecaprenyl-diphosphatase